MLGNYGSTVLNENFWIEILIVSKCAFITVLLLITLILLSRWNPKLDTKWDFYNFLTRRNRYLRSTNIGLTKTVWVKNGPKRFGTLIEQLRFGPSVQWNKFWICTITDRMDSPLRTLGTLAERSEGPWM